MASEQHECGILGCSVLTPVGATLDYFGEGVEVCVSGNEVHVECSSGTLVLGPDEREVFDRLYQEAERQAEAHAAAESHG